MTGVVRTGAGAEAPPVGPPGGSVGSLIVGAAEGLGGRFIRTVSFLGWIFEASGGLGGKAPPGKLGLFSAIINFQVKVERSHCQTLIGKEKPVVRAAQSALLPRQFCRAKRLASDSIKTGVIEWLAKRQVTLS